jgi:hypothetical protein
MQGIHTHIPETNHVPREYFVEAILSLLYTVPLPLVPALALLCFYISTFRSKEARGSIVVKALRYKPSGHGFDSRWCHWNFSVI